MSDVKKQFFGNTDLVYLLGLIKDKMDEYVLKVDGKDLSANDFTDELLAKLNGIAEGAQVNVLEGIKIGDSAAAIVDKVVTLGTMAGKSEIAMDDLASALQAVINAKADAATTLEGYGITDAYTKDEVNAELLKKANVATTLAGYNIGDAYTKTEVDEKIGAQIAAVYKPAGSVAFASLPALAAGVLGNVYNVTDAFVTTADFVEGAGIPYPAGSNVGVVQVSEGVFKFDVMAGFVDLTDYLKTAEIIELTEEEVQAAWESVFGPISE